jgi:hypothetical protein
VWKLIFQKFNFDTICVDNWKNFVALLIDYEDLYVNFKLLYCVLAVVIYVNRCQYIASQ